MHIHNQSTEISQALSGDKIYHYHLHNLLPEQTLAVNTSLGTICLLSREPNMLSEQQFTDSEISLLKPLLDSYPHYCGYETLLASLNSKQTSDKAISYYRLQLQSALEDGTWNHLLKPLHNTLSRARPKLKLLGIGIASIVEVGYILTSYL